MRELHTDAVEYIICPARPVPAATVDGTTRHPFRSLDEALTAIRARAAQDGEAGGAPFYQLDLVCTTRPDEVRRDKRPRHQFFVDAQPISAAGDGSESFPWPDLNAAIGDLERMQAEGRLGLEAGDIIRLRRREPFTPTALERRKHRSEAIAKYLFMAMAVGLVLPVVAILSYAVVEALPVLSLEFLFTNPRNFMTAGGIWAPLVGTFFLSLVSLLACAPVGILAGVYLNEYARDNWFTRIVNLAVMNLAGVPSIVHALFGVGAFVLAANMGKSVLAASCTVAVMSLPVIITATREALGSVPMAFREACWNMGASRWQTIRTVVLPNSVSGMLTGVIFEVSRAAGETAPILFTGAVFYVPVADTGWESLAPYGLFDQFMTLSMHLFTLSTQVVNVPRALPFGTAVVLIGLVLVVNSVSIGLRVYLRSRKKW